MHLGDLNLIEKTFDFKEHVVWHVETDESFSSRDTVDDFSHLELLCSVSQGGSGVDVMESLNVYGMELR